MSRDSYHIKTMFDIALTAQNSKIWDLVTLVQKFYSGIVKHSVVTTLDTGLVIKAITGIDVHLLPCGSEGGYLQLARLVQANNTI
jgi:methylglyoxal synthase